MTPDYLLFDEDIKQISVKEKEGSYSILPRHAPLISVASNGFLKLTKQNGEENFLQFGFGTLNVLREETNFLIDYGFLADSLENCKAGFLKLKEQMQEHATDTDDTTVAQLEMEILKRASELTTY